MVSTFDSFQQSSVGGAFIESPLGARNQAGVFCNCCRELVVPRCRVSIDGLAACPDPERCPGFIAWLTQSHELTHYYTYKNQQVEWGREYGSCDADPWGCSSGYTLWLVFKLSCWNGEAVFGTVRAWCHKNDGLNLVGAAGWPGKAFQGSVTWGEGPLPITCRKTVTDIANLASCIDGDQAHGGAATVELY